tara:strand:+ start:126 stop:701 length:576 start_codon:yes stop_codon:yes gene_type:complete
MVYANLEDIIDKYAKYVIQQARTNLTKDDKGGGSLYNSLGYELDVEIDAFLLQFQMDDYGVFVDKGVRGKDPTKLSPNARLTGQQAPNSPFRFGSGNYAGTWKTFLAKIESWAKSKNVRFREQKGSSKGGQFKAGNYKSIAYVIANNIYNRGIKTSNFFTTPFERAQQRLGDDLLDAFIIDVEKQIIYGEN